MNKKLSRRSFLRFSSFITATGVLQFFFPKKARAFGAFGLMRQGAAAPPYVDDVFSAYTYTGNGATKTITNGIDLLGKGGLVWIKRRNTGDNNVIVDTARGMLNNGATPALFTDAVNTNVNLNVGVQAISTGFTIQTASDNSINSSSGAYVSWTFRKAPKFFDVVTYAGNGTVQSINHSLGITPGMVIVKNTTLGVDWLVWHRSLTSGYFIILNSTAAQNNGNAKYPVFFMSFITSRAISLF